MTNEVEKLVVKSSPIAISYANIFYALKSLLPDQVFVILNSIRKIILIKEKNTTFSTIGITKTGLLYINEDFWNKHVHSLNVLKTLMMHELLHCIGGDVFFLEPKDKAENKELRAQADHLAMDARINSFICMNRPDIEPQKFLKEYYTDELCEVEFLQKILRPDSIFRTDEEMPLKTFHDKLYNSLELGSHHDLSDTIFNILKKRPAKKKLLIKLLGTHGEEGKELTDKELEGIDQIEIDMSDLTQEDLKKIQEDLKKQGKSNEKNRKDSPEKKDQGQGSRIKEAIIDHLSETSALGCGRSKEAATILLNQCLEITEKFDLNKFKHIAFNNIFHNVRTAAKERVGKYTTSPILPTRIATSDLILMSCKVPILFYKTKKYVSKINKNLLPIYLDVSGSTWSFLPEIVRLIANISSKELDFVWGFSNIIAKHTIQDLEEGKIHGTGGTDFDCIVDHALANEFAHIVVITDGDANCRFDSKVAGISSVTTVLFGHSASDNFFSNVYGNTHSIEEVKL